MKDETMKTVIFDQTPSRQDIVDAVFIRARDGRGRSYNDDECICSYAAKDGNRCFIGIFLDPERFSLVPLNVKSIAYGDYGKVPVWLKDHLNFLLHIQGLHDRAENWIGKKFDENLLKGFCESRGLIYREPV